MTDDIDSGMDNSFEMLDISATTQRRDLANRAIATVSDYLNKYPIAIKGVLGGMGGYITGVVFKKVGKIAASAVGGGLVLLQIANKAGYITINTRRMNRDARLLESRVRNEIRRNESSVEVIMRNTEQFIRTNSPAALGFAAGFLIGLAS